MGSKLLQLAKDWNPDRMELYTFQCNKIATAFYKKHGFIVKSYGTVNEENLPDILFIWQPSLN